MARLSINHAVSLISAGARWPWVQVGQFVHPSPDPVRRTVAPVTTMAARDTAANNVTRR